MLGRLKTMDLAAAHGAQIRSRVKWVEEGESSSSFFCRLEKKLCADRVISTIRSDDGSVVSSPEDLCAAFKAFYVDLFSAMPVDATAQAELLSHVSSLPASDSAACEGFLTLEECFSALSGMARGKAPGCDGLPMEFFLNFGTSLVKILWMSRIFLSCQVAFLVLSVMVSSLFLLRKMIVWTRRIGGPFLYLM